MVLEEYRLMKNLIGIINAYRQGEYDGKKFDIFDYNKSKEINDAKDNTNDKNISIS